MPTLRWPRYDLESSIEVARAIFQGAGGEASLDAAASLLGYKSKNNGAFISRIGASKLFGLVDGQRLLGTTPLALAILQPDYPETEGEARLEAFRNVPLFRAFLAEYEGKPLPNQTGMKNALLTRFGVKNDRLGNMALARLLDSAEQAGLFTISGTRQKMITPNFRKGIRADASPQTEEGSLSPGSGRSEQVMVSGQRSSPLPKVVEGALEEVPWNNSWDEDGLTQWVEWFEGALRMHFKLPKGRSGHD